MKVGAAVVILQHAVSRIAVSDEAEVVLGAVAVLSFAFARFLLAALEL